MKFGTKLAVTSFRRLNKWIPPIPLQRIGIGATAKWSYFTCSVSRSVPTGTSRLHGVWLENDPTMYVVREERSSKLRSSMTSWDGTAFNLGQSSTVAGWLDLGWDLLLKPTRGSGVRDSAFSLNHRYQPVSSIGLLWGGRSSLVTYISFTEHGRFGSSRWKRFARATSRIPHPRPFCGAPTGDGWHGVHELAFTLFKLLLHNPNIV